MAVASAMRLFSELLIVVGHILAAGLHLLFRSPPKPPPTAPTTQEPVSRRDEIARLFRAFDRDNDGKIEAAELENTLKDLGIFVTRKDLVEALAEVDADGDGCLGEKEFAELYGRIVGEEKEEEMRDAFDVFDEDGDGYITAEELRSVMGTLGLEQGRRMDECRRMIRSADANGDGRIDFNEFMVLMRRGNPLLVS